MKLYDHPLSPYSLKVRILLYEKGVPFESLEIETEAQREELRRVNPRAEVPALEDDGAVVFDSKVMAEYIEERHPEPPLLPADLATRARVRGLELLADTQLDAAMMAFALMKVFRPAMAAEHPQALARAEAALRTLYRHLDEELGEREYLVGPISRADVAVVPHVLFASVLGSPPDDATPRLARWTERMNARPSVQRATSEAMASFEKSSQVKDPFFQYDRLHWRSDRIEHLFRIGLDQWVVDQIRSGAGFLPPLAGET